MSQDQPSNKLSLKKSFDSFTKSLGEGNKARCYINTLLFFIFDIIFVEMFFKLFAYKSFVGTFNTIFFSLMWGTFLFLVSTLFNQKINRIIALILSYLVSLWMCVQCVYYAIFKMPLSFFSLMTGAEDAAGDFLGVTFSYILKCAIPIIVFFFPPIFLTIFLKRIFCFDVNWKSKAVFAIAVLVLYLLGNASMLIQGLFPEGKYDQAPFAQYYGSSFDVSIAIPKFGVLTALRLDIQHTIAPNAYKSVQNGAMDESGIDYQNNVTATDPEVDRSPQVMNIDFNKLILNEQDSNIKEMHQYFSSVTPSNKNEYTGIFKDCNLIYMTCEGFSHYALDKELTPTLYKLANESFVFENFYTPIWGVSTSDGEYVSCQGLIPKSGVWSFSRSGDNYLPFALGNQFLKQKGYSIPKAYHNHTYDYYDRNLSHPNMGYIYRGLYGGLDYNGKTYEGIDVQPCWPESDLEMMQKTIPDYINDEKFHTYYMTVSGHLQYNFGGNSMSSKNKDAVANLNMSDACKAYLACNIELDKAMEYLLAQLKAAEKLENTVIVMSADHYPYGLEKNQIDEFAGHTVEENFELYKNACIIWKYGMEKKVISDPVSSMDILPTVSNLFGLEYDSRLLMGRDIFGGTMPLVIFNNRSFITDKCSYNSQTGIVVSFTGEKISDEYIKGLKNLVSNRFRYSASILDYDYYAKVLT